MWAIRCLRAAILLFLVAPLVVAIGSSLTPSSVPEFPPSAISFQWYWHVLEQEIFVQAAWHSLQLAALSTLINLPIALCAALALLRGRVPGHAMIQTVLMSPLIVPAVVTGIAVLLAFAQAGWRDPFSRLLLAHLVITLPYLVRTIIASLSRLDIHCEEAAATLGASPLKVFLLVTMPQLMPGIIAGALFAFIISFDNVSVSLFLASARFNTLPIAVLAYVEHNLDPSIAALSTLLILITVALTLLIERVAGLRRTLGA